MDGRRRETPGDDGVFGDELRRWRSKRDLSLAGLARLVHYSKGYLSKIENGDKPVTPDVAQRCDDALGAGGQLVALVPQPRGPEGTVEIPQQPVHVDGRRPYRGLAAFTAEDAEWFFGRERDTAELVALVAERLGEGGPVVVVAPSGAGKSSLLRAGLVPAVRRGVLPVPGGRAVVFTPTADPAGQFAQHLPGATVLIVDQFEEVFTLCPDERQREEFVAALCELAVPGGPAVVLGVRADYYGHLLAYPRLVLALRDSQVALGPMTADQVRDAIVRPARLAGLELEPGLVELLLRDLGVGASGGSYEPGALPLLAHALLTTWQNREGRVLTAAGYQLTGGLQSAVATTAERAYSRQSAEAKVVARSVLLRLVHVRADTGQTRRRATVEHLYELELGDGLAEVLSAFVRARLLTVDTGTIEITHEALIGAWPRLREWIETDRAGLCARQRLAESVEAWQRHGRDRDSLYRGASLAVADAWACAHQPETTAAEREFLAASKREQHRGVRRLRRLVAALSVLVLLAGAATAAAFWQSEEATRQRDRALSTVSSHVANLASSQRATNPALAAQLALAAHQHAPTAESRGAALGSASPIAGRLRADTEGWVRTAAFSPDGNRLVIGTTTGVTQLWHVSSHRSLGVVPTTREVSVVAFHPTHPAALLTAGVDGVRLWNVTDPAKPVELYRLDEHTARAAAISRDGAMTATAGADHTVRLWNTTDPEHPVHITTRSGHEDEVAVATFSPDGRFLFTGDRKGTALLWDTRDLNRTPQPLPGPRRAPEAAAFSPDGRLLVTSGGGYDVQFHTIDDRGHAEPAGHLKIGNIIFGLAFSPDGTVLATGGNDKKISLWHLPSRRRLTQFGHPNRVLDIAFAPDGRTLAGTSVTGSVQLWHEPLSVLTDHAVRRAEASDDLSGRVLAATGGVPAGRVWDLTDPEHRTLVATLPPDADPVSNAVFSPHNDMMATTSHGKPASLWRLAGVDRLTLLARLQVDDVVAVALRPGLLATGDNRGRLMLWSLDNPSEPRLLKSIEDNFDDVNTIAFDPSGSRIATGDTRHGVRLWDIGDPANPRPLAAHTTHTDAVASVAFSPDGRTLVSTGYDWTVRLWDLNAADRAPAVLTGHTNTVVTAAFDRSSRFLLTATADTVRLWTMTAPGQATPYAELKTGVSGRTTFSADSRAVVLINGEVVHRWDLDTAAVSNRICAYAGEPITQQEWRQYFGEDTYAPPCG